MELGYGIYETFESYKLMHFVFVERGYPRDFGETGGAGVYVRNFGKELIRRGHLVSVICGKNLGDAKMFYDGEIKVYPDYQNHSIAFFLQKFKIFNFFISFLKYIEDGASIRKILKKINNF